jgi:hypothetical protein
MTFSRDVIVDEAKSWDWIAGSSTSRPLISQASDDEVLKAPEDAPEVAPEDTNAEVLETPEVAPEDTNAEVLETNGRTRRSTRPRQIPARIQDCEIVNDNEVNEDGDLVHFALLAGAEPINYRSFE